MRKGRHAEPWHRKGVEMDDERRAEENYTELQKRFRDLWVAIVDKKVIAYGKNLAKVEEEARLKTGKIWQRKEQGPRWLWIPVQLMLSSTGMWQKFQAMTPLLPQNTVT